MGSSGNSLIGLGRGFAEVHSGQRHEVRLRVGAGISFRTPTGNRRPRPGKRTRKNPAGRRRHSPCLGGGQGDAWLLVKS